MSAPVVRPATAPLAPAEPAEPHESAEPAAPAEPAPPPVTRRPRLRALDGLRLVAALMVCGYHYAGRGGEISASWGRSPAAVFPHLAGPSSYGFLGVQIFFVISGFVICMSGWGRGLKDFTISRVTRLYPAYWAALLLVSAVFAVAGMRRVPDSDLLVNFTMLQTPAGAQRVLGVCWTLWAELRFYLLFALAVVLPGATRRRVLVFCALWTVGALYAGTSGNAFLREALMPEYAPYFVAGMGMYLIYRFGHDAFAWGVVLTGYLLGQHYAVLSSVAPAHQHVFHHRTPVATVAVVTAGFAAVAVVTLVPRVAGLQWRWLTTAGALTYPFYLVHEHLGWVVIGRLTRHTDLPPLAVLAVATGSLLALAWLLHRLVERPVAPRLKRLLERPSGR